MKRDDDSTSIQRFDHILDFQVLDVTTRACHHRLDRIRSSVAGEEPDWLDWPKIA